MCTALFLNGVIFKKSTSKNENTLAIASYLNQIIEWLEHNLKRDIGP